MENTEISIEANPDDLTKDKIKELSENFNRISIENWKGTCYY